MTESTVNRVRIPFDDVADAAHETLVARFGPVVTRQLLATLAGFNAYVISELVIRGGAPQRV